MRSALLACLLAGPLLAAPVPIEPKWGTITGRFAWDGVAPANPVVKAIRDKAHCTSKGDLLKDELIVDPKTKGVKNIALWLVDAKDHAKKLPVHPDAAKALPRRVEVAVPCCRFEPRVVVLSEGQELVAANPSPVAHAFRLQPLEGPGVNVLLKPDSRYVAGKVAPALVPALASCPIHPWMRGWVLAVPSPHAAVTGKDGSFTIKEAPVGEWVLMAWHERTGWVFRPPGKIDPKGRRLKVKAGTNDLGTMKFAAPDD
ncbi:MAG: hypothetical protein K2W96_01210 [Gemmataceae bacterium]|nr:hypothetical protein [Gemmataceae bacterium]